MRTIYLADSLTPALGRKIINELLELNEQNNVEPIDLIITTGGGSANYCYAIIKTMQEISAPVHTYCIGHAYSAGGAIFINGEPGHRYITKSSFVMLHMPRGVFTLNDDDGHHTEFRMMQERMVAALSNRSITEVSKDLRLELYMKGQEVVDYGLADHILG